MCIYDTPARPVWFRERWIYYVHVYRITLFLNYLAQIASSLVLLMLGGPLLISSPAGVVDEDPAARCHKVKAVHLRICILLWWSCRVSGGLCVVFFETCLFGSNLGISTTYCLCLFGISAYRHRASRVGVISVALLGSCPSRYSSLQYMLAFVLIWISHT